MSGTYPPIAGLSPDNQGPINTIVAIVLCATSILFSSVRYAIGRKKLLQFRGDDAMFGIALLFSIATSVVSNASVGAGLGQHQAALSQKSIERFFKLRWTSQFLSVGSFTCSKLSIILMYRRIVPVALAPLTLKILVPVTSMYALICVFMFGFQCQLPSPWVLDPKTCSTHGNVYYAAIALNIVTDILLAGWIVPCIWALQMKKNTKLLVISLLASRMVVCAFDLIRLFFLRRALNSDDQTWSQLIWAIFDQVVVHLSLNHATLPRVHVFLSNLQTGLLQSRLTTTMANTNSSGSKRSRDVDQFVPLEGPDSRGRRARWKWLQRSRGSPVRSRSRVADMLRFSDKTKDDSTSERPLCLQPEQGIELSTTIYADGDSASSAGGKTEGREEWGQQGLSNGGSIHTLPVEHLSRSESERLPRTGPLDLMINVHKTVEITTEVLNGKQRSGR